MSKKQKNLIPQKPQLVKFAAPRGPLTAEQIGVELKKLVPFFQRLGFTNFLVLGYRIPTEIEVKERKLTGEIPYCFPFFPNSFETAAVVHDFDEMLRRKNEDLFLSGKISMEGSNGSSVRVGSPPDPQGVEVEKRPEGGQFPGLSFVPGPGAGTEEK